MKLKAPFVLPFPKIHLHHINIPFCVYRLILRDEVSGDIAGLLRLYRSILNGLMLLPLSSLAKAASKPSWAFLTCLACIYTIIHAAASQCQLNAAIYTAGVRPRAGFAGDCPLRGRDPLPGLVYFHPKAQIFSRFSVTSNI